MSRILLKDYERTFNLRWEADMRAIKFWQDAHPGKEKIWPDHVDLVLWLMDRLTEMAETIAQLQALPPGGPEQPEKS